MRDLNNQDILQGLAYVKPSNVIPTLEQGIEVEKLNLTINSTQENEDKIRDLTFLLNFFRIRGLG
jgi:hypothetical protein